MKVKKHPRKKVILTWDKPTKIDNKQLAGLNQCTMNLKIIKERSLKKKDVKLIIQKMEFVKSLYLFLKTISFSNSNKSFAKSFRFSLLLSSNIEIISLLRKNSM